MKDRIIKNAGLWFFDICLILMAWGGESRLGFGCDTTISKYYEVPFQTAWLASERAMSYFTGKALYQAFGFVPLDHQRVCFLFFILCLGCSVFLIQKLFLNNCTGSDLLVKAGYILAPFLLFINVLFSEFFMFPECYIVFGLCFFLASLGCYIFANSTGGVLLIAIAGSFYQVGLVYAALILTTFLVIKDDFRFTKKLFAKVLLTDIIILFFEVIYMKTTPFLVKLEGVEIEKKATFAISNNLVQILKVEIPLFLKNSLSLLPSVYAPLLFFAVGLLCLIAILRRTERKKWLTVALWLPALASLALVIPVVQGNRLVPRTAISLYVLQCVFAIGCISLGSRTYRKMMTVSLVGYLTIQIVFCNVIQSNHYLSNELDKLYANELVKEIEQYEQKTGAEITKLAIEVDAYAPHYFPQVDFYRDQINESALKWTPRQLIPLATGRDFEPTEMDEAIYKEYFEGRDWEEFDLREQLIIKGDTAYWCIF